MGSKVVLALCMIILSSVSVRVSSSVEDDLNDYIGKLESGGQQNLCMEKLLPCQPYIDAPLPPSANCCEPLKQIISDQVQCLCESLDNPMVMQTLNVTKDTVLKLPKACGANFDEAVCKTAAGTAPATDSMSPLASDTTPAADSSPEAESKTSAANGISSNFMFGGYSILLLAMVMSVY